LHGNCGGVARPIAVFTPHTSADGIVFYDGQEFGADYADNAFVTEWGANAGGPAGRRLLRGVLSGSGGPDHGQVSDFATGFSSTPSNRPASCRWWVTARSSGLGVGSPDG